MEPSAPGESMISAPKTWRSWRRSVVTLSGITTVSRWPRSRAIMARLMPVLPLVGSRMIESEVSRPVRSRSSMSALAMRSFSEPVGLNASSFAQRTTLGLGDIRGMATSGVRPIASSIDS